MLYLVATPIGNPQDITLRALDVLKKVEFVITEERKVGSAFIRSLQLGTKKYFELNEHTTEDELNELAELCKKQEVALISDCGTPGFCDPGSLLVKKIRKLKIPMTSVPGASSLMVLLSLTSQRIDRFLFFGFLPQKTEDRAIAWKKILQEKTPVILMDTPYRFQKTLHEISSLDKNKKILLGINLTCPDEQIYDGIVSDLNFLSLPEKAEFVLLLF
jgi:16S rRNA (cytidine1402-2'-O)-methyltransferase